jgi:hypothetical protein
VTPELSRTDLSSDGARASFDRIYALAEHLEWPESSADDDAVSRDRQYQRVGALVARYCTLLLVAWDGKNTEHTAGTARAVEYRRGGIAPTADEEPLPTNALLAAHDNDLMCW